MINFSQNSYYKSEEESRIVKDNIHGYIKFDKPLWKIIDTPEFQRMRDIKQTGCAYYVYPGAIHTRFEHCVGTGFLAQKLANKLKTSSDISEQDAINVTIAGLGHDLGHATFSHLFEKLVMKKLEYAG